MYKFRFNYDSNHNLQGGDCMMKYKSYFILMINIFLIISFILIGRGEEEFLKRGKSDGISFLSGGVGIHERKTLNEIGRNYSLKIIFSNKKGEFLSNIMVRVLDQHDKVILTTVSNGPWLFIDLPSGSYQIEASFKEDHKRLSKVNVEKGTQKVIFLQW